MCQTKPSNRYILTLHIGIIKIELLLSFLWKVLKIGGRLLARLCCNFFCEVISGLWAQFGQAQSLAYSVGSGLSSVHWPMQSIVFNNSSGLHFQFLARNALLRHHGVFAWGLRPCRCSWMLKDRFFGNAISYGGTAFYSDSMLIWRIVWAFCMRSCLLRHSL